VRFNVIATAPLGEPFCFRGFESRWVLARDGAVVRYEAPILSDPKLLASVESNRLSDSRFLS